MTSFFKEYAEDNENDFIVYCYLTTVGRLLSLDAKFLLMIDKKEQKREDKVKALLQNVHKIYTMVGKTDQNLMNPLHVINSKIKSDEFAIRVQELIKEYLF